MFWQSTITQAGGLAAGINEVCWSLRCISYPPSCIIHSTEIPRREQAHSKTSNVTYLWNVSNVTPTF
jgi:hypothetical protein